MREITKLTMDRFEDAYGKLDKYARELTIDQRLALAAQLVVAEALRDIATNIPS